MTHPAIPRTLKGALLAGLTLLVLGLPKAQAQVEAGGKAQKPALDPFVVLVEKPKPKRPVARPTVRRPSRPQAPRVPPLTIKIQTIIGAGDENLAVIEYKGNELIVGKGWPEGDEPPPGWDKRFKVVEVSGEKMIVYDQLAKQRKTVRLSDDFSAEGVELGG